jgi:flagellin
MSAVGSILTNTGALQALNSIATTTNTNNNLENQLSSGLAISSPANNPAGYITAQGFTSQLNGITQAISNANTGVSLLQTAQGAITQQIGVVQQLNSIAVQAANGTQTPAEAQSLQTVVGQLTSQVSTIAKQTQFNNISLLNGSFSGVQFQVGANEGQTQTLSIGNLAASAIGLNATTASTTKYVTGGATSSGVVTTNAGAAVASGAFAATAVTITGGNGGTATVTPTSTLESAASLATAINDVSGTTGVSAQATNTVTLNIKSDTAAVAAGSSTPFKFVISAQTNSASGVTGTVGSAQTVIASSAAQIVSQINGKSSTSGITASLNTSGQLVLNQAAGDNIAINYTGGATSGSLTTTGATTETIGSGTQALLQGQVQLQASAAFSASGASAIGQSKTSSLTALSQINVSTTSGANTAINVVKYALAALNNQGGELGAVQQALTANINNLNTTSQNVTSALGVVQDANIPAVSNQLTQATIQAQAGVAALKNSTQLQQAFLSLLP